MLRHIRSWVYRLGFRPKSGAILFSPSLALLFGYRDHKKAIDDAWCKALEVSREAWLSERKK